MKVAKLFDSFLRIMGALFCLGLLFTAGFWIWPYAQALAWHLEHGNFAYVGEYQVPVATWVRPHPHQYPLSLDLRPGKFGYMVFGLGRKVTPGVKWTEAWETNSKSPDPCIAGISREKLARKSIPVMIADQPSRCLEQSSNSLDSFFGFEINCTPEREERGLTVNYVGSPELKPVFYETLSKITRREHK